MKRTALQVLLAAFAVTLAGCSGGILATGAQAQTGSVDLYISDEPNAMDEFDHLTVTITEVGFQQGGENGSWEERSVDNATVDLSELRGANASLLDRYELENGTYTKTFVYVSDINATLTSGEQVDVKLPSEKLHVNQDVTVGNGSETDFVFDITVHEAGNSGKYILKPVVSESGTDVPIEPVGEDAREALDRDDVGESEDENEDEREDENESDAGDEGAAFDVSVDGNVSAGETVTVQVTENGSAVGNATVEVDGDVVGTTGTDGTITVQVPETGELDVEIEKGDSEAEWELERDA
jgi:hypothetical protein